MALLKSKTIGKGRVFKTIALGTLVAGSLLVTSLAGSASASPKSYGDLDPTFGSGGKVITDFNSERDEAHGVAIQPNGKIVVVGESWPNPDRRGRIAIARYNGDGSLDTSFGDGGKVISSPASDYDSAAYAVTIQSDEKIVVAGSTWAPDAYSPCFAVARYNTDGSLDTSFGDNGFAITHIDPTNGTENRAQAVSIAPDGKIVAAGYYGRFFITNDFAVTRYNTDGSPDTSFGTGGVVTYDSGVGEDTGRAVAVQYDGKVVVAGNISEGSGNDDFGAIRLNLNGSLDTNFGVGGVVRNDFLGGADWATGLVIRPDQKIVLGGLTQMYCPSGCSKYGFGMVQYNPDGNLDPSFGNGGAIAYDFVSSSAAYALTRRDDGRMVAVGHSGNIDFAVALIQENGQLDPSFGDAGYVRTDFATGTDRAYAVAVQADAKVVVAGRVVRDPNSNAGDGDFGVARYIAPPFGSQSTPTPVGSTPTATQEPGGATPTPGSGCQISYSDVPAGSTFYPYVECLACQSIVSGFPDGTFRPNADITRGQLAKIISNAALWNDPVSGQTFSDVPPDSTFYVYIERAAGHGVIGGYSDGTFRPGNNATRGQIAKIVANSQGWNDPVSGQSFSDVAPGSTFYEYVERAASHGVIGGYSDGTFRPGNNATRGQTSKIVSNAFFPDCQTHFAK